MGTLQDTRHNSEGEGVGHYEHSYWDEQLCQEDSDVYETALCTLTPSHKTQAQSLVELDNADVEKRQYVQSQHDHPDDDKNEKGFDACHDGTIFEREGEMECSVQGQNSQGVDR